MLFVSLFGPGCWAPFCFFFGRAFCVCFCLCFLFFLCFFRSLFGPGCWAPCCSFFGRAFCVCFGVFSFFLRKRFFHFFLIFCPFFLFIFALTFHKYQIAKKAVLSFFCLFLRCLFFLFHFCFDIPQVSVC